jgi:hypothetical protein
MPLLAAIAALSVCSSLPGMGLGVPPAECVGVFNPAASVEWTTRGNPKNFGLTPEYDLQVEGDTYVARSDLWPNADRAWCMLIEGGRVEGCPIPLGWQPP